MNIPILSYMPATIKQALQGLDAEQINWLEEVRIRVGRPVELVIRNQSFFLTTQGTISSQAEQGLIPDEEVAHKIMNLISRHSVYAVEEELKRGYITVAGGHRVGIAGRGIIEEGRLKLLRDIKSFNFRIAKEVKNIASPLLPSLIEQGRLLNTLIISPPRCGKTTLLRDMIRVLSRGEAGLLLQGQKIGVVDERSEIASCLEGIPQKDLGPRVDVLDACPKAEGMMMLIRSMSPDIIATDEIGSEEDASAIMEAIYAGVGIVTTVHGSSVEDIRKRPKLKELLSAGSFQRYIVLSKRRGVGTIEAILDGEARKIRVLERGEIYA